MMALAAAGPIGQVHGMGPRAAHGPGSAAHRWPLGRPARPHAGRATVVSVSAAKPDPSKLDSLWGALEAQQQQQPAAAASVAKAEPPVPSLPAELTVVQPSAAAAPSDVQPAEGVLSRLVSGAQERLEGAGVQFPSNSAPGWQPAEPTSGGQGLQSLKAGAEQIDGPPGLQLLADKLNDLAASLREGSFAGPDLEALSAQMERLTEAASQTLLGQGLETLFEESSRLDSSGVFDTNGLVPALTKLGLPKPIRNFIAHALDLEFDLAEDGAPGVVALLLVAFALVAVFAALRGSKGKKDDSLPQYYDQEAAEQFFRKRPAKVLFRLAELVSTSAAFLMGVMSDRRSGTTANDEKRARQCVKLLTDLGPTFVKIGQALSIRVDLLSPAYIAQLRTLQDSVLPFPTPEAKQILADELTRGDVSQLDRIFVSFPEEPIAAASLGQVYRCRLRATGQEVAVKVQRPNVLEGIMLDLYLLRLVAPVAKKASGLNSDLEGLVDEWGTRFVAELDYLREAQNGREFTAAMQTRGITAVTAAEIIDGVTTPRVLTSKWVEGQRLEESSAKDVSRLCGVALNAYLTMLLDTGTLHADPHPGNLLRSNGGRLVILDWGLVTYITKDQQYALVDYIANLVSESYQAIPTDLVALGFVPPGKERLIEEAGVVRVLSNVLRQLSGGGGAAKINVDALISELQGMTSSYGNLFQIPPYFAYILRAFTVLEGIGLSNDPDYAIVQECYPTLAQRLFVDPSQRTRTALRRMVLTAGEEQIDVDQILKLLASFQRFSASTQGLDGDGDGDAQIRGEADQALDREILSIVFSEEPNYLQEILLEGAAKALDAVSRDRIAGLLGMATTGPVAGLFQQQQALANFLGPLRSVLFPLPLPGEVLGSLGPRLSKTAEDEAQLELIQKVVSAAQDELQRSGALPGDQQDRLSALLDMVNGAILRSGPLLPELAPGLTATWTRFQAVLLQRAADRLEDERLREAAQQLHARSLPRPQTVTAAGR